MPAANYRELITIQKPVANPALDDAGHWDPANAENWEDHGTAWADIQVRGSKDFYRAGIVSDEVDHLIKVRYCTLAASVLGSYRVKRADGSFVALTGPAYDADNCRRELWMQGKS